MAATKQNHSIAKGTFAELVTAGGDYTGQSGFASDQGLGLGLRYVWNGTIWILPTEWQRVAFFTTQNTLAADTAEHILLSYTLPKLGANGMAKVRTFLSGLTNNANAKTVKVNLDATGAGTGAAIDCASSTAANLEVEFRNANNASSQKWISNAKANFGAFSGSLQATSRATGTAGVVMTLVGIKAVAGDAMVFDWGDMWLCGGGD